jgi:hypothetical protein
MDSDDVTQGTAFVTFKNEGIAHRVYHKQAVKAFRWAHSVVKIETWFVFLLPCSAAFRL